jgi:catechol 2,3-dioxygenase-like lactoylglutathione lyase family enzyme
MEPMTATPPPLVGEMAALAASIRKSEPMFWVADMRATVAWYESIGFRVEDRFEDDGELVFARVTFGAGAFALSPGAKTGPRDVRMWFFTDRVRELYRAVKTAAEAGNPAIVFDEELYQPFYGGEQFSIHDPNGLSLIFWQPVWLSPEPQLEAG